MTGGDFRAAFLPFWIFCGIGLLLLPLGVWKLVEIIIWCIHHIHIGVK